MNVMYKCFVVTWNECAQNLYRLIFKNNLKVIGASNFKN